MSSAMLYTNGLPTCVNISPIGFSKMGAVSIGDGRIILEDEIIIAIVVEVG